MYNPRYIIRLENIPELSDEEKNRLKMVTDKFAFRANDYYLSLIDWNDPDDPIRRIIVPDEAELNEWGELDACDESAYTVARGCEHKYGDTALLLVNDVCGAYCRFCFRKRIFMNDNDEVVRDVSDGLAYIRNHPEINNVLLTGGDPLLLGTRKLERIIAALREIDHVNIIRIGTKMPAFNPYRVINDKSIIEMFSKYSTKHKKIYIVVHFNHPNELTGVAIEGIDLLHKAGCITVNQTPLIRGVNDNPEVLAELFKKLSHHGIPPYYVFICRPTMGNLTYSLPIEESYEIFEKSRSNCSGLAKRARLTMSHAHGKIEVIGLDEEQIYFKFHRAAEKTNNSRFLAFRRNPEAYWIDDYEEAAQEFALAQARELIGFDRFNIS